jgi:hypothetical protein
MRVQFVLAGLTAALTFASGCKGAKDDFHENVCEALSASGGNASAPTKEDLDNALAWSADHVSHSDLKKVLGMIRANGVAKSWIPSLLRTGGKEYASYDGACALADAFEKVYPCPPSDPDHCGKNVQ